MRKEPHELTMRKYPSLLSICEAKFRHHVITTPFGHPCLSFTVAQELCA